MVGKGLERGKRNVLEIRSQRYRIVVKRRLLTIAIFLLAGAVVNVAVAWGMVAFVHPYLRPLPVFHLESAKITFGGGQSVVQFVVIAGWPLTCSSYEYRSYGGVGSIAGGLKLDGWPRALPLRPVWPGFAINTLFYAAILWLIIPGPFVLRRLIRRRRGLCPACGYDLRHAEHEACPECGVTA